MPAPEPDALQELSPTTVYRTQFFSTAARKNRSKKMKISWMWVGQVQNGCW
jgi:hypothetical protein